MSDAEAKTRIVQGHVEDIKQWIYRGDYHQLEQLIEQLLELDDMSVGELIENYRCYFPNT